VQAAVPKFMQLRLSPASGTSLSPGGAPVTQRISVTNSMQAGFALPLRHALHALGDECVAHAHALMFFAARRWFLLSVASWSVAGVCACQATVVAIGGAPPLACWKSCLTADLLCSILAAFDI
jgi:hypothetical protein